MTSNKQLGDVPSSSTYCKTNQPPIKIQEISALVTNGHEGLLSEAPWSAGSLTPPAPLSPVARDDGDGRASRLARFRMEEEVLWHTERARAV